MDHKFSGECLCKEVKVDFTLEERKYSACHCSMCRKWGSGPLMAILDAKNVVIHNNDNISVYNSSGWGERAFCKSCGCNLFYKVVGKEEYYISYGLIEDQEEFDLSVQIFIDDKPSTYSFEQETKCLTGQEILDMYSN